MWRQSGIMLSFYCFFLDFIGLFCQLKAVRHNLQNLHVHIRSDKPTAVVWVSINGLTPQSAHAIRCFTATKLLKKKHKPGCINGEKCCSHLTRNGCGKQLAAWVFTTSCSFSRFISSVPSLHLSILVTTICTSVRHVTTWAIQHKHAHNEQYSTWIFN